LRKTLPWLNQDVIIGRVFGMHGDLEKVFQTLSNQADFVSLRWERVQAEMLGVTRGVAKPPAARHSEGVMLTVHHHGGLGYAATADLSQGGLTRAFAEARDWAAATKGKMVAGVARPPAASPRLAARTAARMPWASAPLKDKLARLMDAAKALKTDARIVDWGGSLDWKGVESLFLSSDGAHIRQDFEVLQPYLYATAAHDGETQTRSFGNALVRQGGLEILDDSGFDRAAARIAAEAIALAEAPPCPSGRMDAVIAADQMVLQIHESIGHPLELDRILGDERNYAGTSFVTPDMFGTYRYGSEHLNITFDPTIEGEASSYAFDDEGTPASREYLIKSGVLQRPLGSAQSQRRANLPGVANARACHWNRPPIDRMANLNLEPGTETLAQLVARVERGVYMETNRAWSIDDSRNKFQVGCEFGRVIENGKLGHVVKNPSYRGISSQFWRSLSGVGDRSSWQILGAANCGKGEPNQAVRVGHATPDCLFHDIDVFGTA
jgi:predicted Zn-dependent protease